MTELLKWRNWKLNTIVPATPKKERIWFTAFTCPYNCTGCYNEESRKLYPNTVVPYRDEHYFLTKQYYYLSLLAAEIVQKEAQYVRLHVEGEFYSKEYARLINSLVQSFPKVRFFTYTKHPENLIGTNLMKLPNINIISSYTDDNTYNFSDNEDILKKWIAKGWFLCPATEFTDVTCQSCKACFFEKKVYFRYHGNTKLSNRK